MYSLTSKTLARNEMEGDSKSKNFQIADHDTYPQGKLKISLEVKNNSSKCQA